MTRTDSLQPSLNHSTEPIPLRFCWLKRILIVVAIVIVCLAVVRWWWGIHATNAFQAEIDRLLAAGEPIYYEQFDLPPVPDEQNAALLYKEAVQRLTEDQIKLIGDCLQYGDEWQDYIEEIQQVTESSASSRSLVRRARELHRANWGLPAQRFGASHIKFSQHQHLIELQYLSALESHQLGNDAEMLENLRDILAYGRSVDQLRMLLASCFHHGASDLVAKTIEQAVPTLRVANKEVNHDLQSKAATTTQIHKLIADLLDENALREGKIWAFARERTILFDCIQVAFPTMNHSLFPNQTSSLSCGPRLWLFIFRPMFQLDGIRVLRYNTAIVKMARASNWHQAQHHSPQTQLPSSRLKSYTRLLSILLSPKFSGICRHLFESAARRRMAAIALAIRLYQKDHIGLPKTLNDLVPNYLPRIPEDPFSADGSPITYQPDAKQPMLLSIGPASRSIRFQLSDQKERSVSGNP